MHRVSAGLVVLAAAVMAACGGGGGSGGSNPPVNPPPAPNPPTGTAPTRISFSSDFVVVASGQSATLTWDSDAAGCTASAGWTGAKSASGSLVVGPLTTTTNFDLSCATGSFTPQTATLEVKVAAAPGPASHVVSVSGLTSLDYVKLDIGMRDLVWDPQRSLFYGITRSDSPIAPSSLVSIDPQTRATRATALGAAPVSIAVSADGTLVYVGFGTGGSIRRFNAIDLTQNLAFNVGTAGSGIAQIVVSPQSSHTIAVRATALEAANDSVGIVIVDDAVSRPGKLSGALTYGPLSFANLELSDIDWSADGTHILAGIFSLGLLPPDGQPTGFFDLAVTQQGVAISRHLPFPLLGQGTLQGDRYYAKHGEVFSLDGPIHYLGSMPYRNSPFHQNVTSLARGKTFNTSTRLNTAGNAGGVTLDSFDTARFTYIDSIVFGGASQVAPSLPVLWGTDGVALVATTELAIARGSFMEAGGVPPAPAIATPSTVMLNVSNQPFRYSIFDVGALAIAANPCGHIYVATDSLASPRPNAVLDVDVATMLVTRVLSVGSDPSVLAASDDCSQLYVGYLHSDSVTRVRLSDFTTSNTLPLNFDAPTQGYLANAQSMSVAAGLPGTVAIAKGDMEYSDCVRRNHGIEIFDGDVRRPASAERDISPTIKSVAWGANAGTLYGMGTAGVFAFNVNAGGVYNPAALMIFPMNPPSMLFDIGRALYYDRAGNRVYTAMGDAYDIASSTRLSQFAVPTLQFNCGTPTNGVTTDTTSGKVFYVSESVGGYTIAMKSSAALASAGSIALTNLNIGLPLAAVRPSADTLAVLADDGSVLVMQGAALQP